MPIVREKNPEDSIYCEFCGDDIRILSAVPAKSTPVNRHGKTVPKKPSLVSVFVLITATLLLSASMIWIIVRITSPGIMMTDDGKYHDYKYYAKNAQSTGMCFSGHMRTEAMILQLRLNTLRSLKLKILLT